MAEGRMLTKRITDDDNFLTLSASAQALYLHLLMSADDDGFSNQVAVSMFKGHASTADLEALINKGYSSGSPVDPAVHAPVPDIQLGTGKSIRPLGMDQECIPEGIPVQPR